MSPQTSLQVGTKHTLLKSHVMSSPKMELHKMGLGRARPTEPEQKVVLQGLVSIPVTLHYL